MDDGPLLDVAVPDVMVLGGGEHGLQRVDAVGEQHPVAVGTAGVVVALVDDSPHVKHLQHRLHRLGAGDVIGDQRHPAGGQLHRRRHRARGISVLEASVGRKSRRGGDSILGEEAKQEG